MTRAITAARAALVIVRLRWRRVRNRFLARPQKTSPGVSRAATPGKGRSAWLTALVGGYFAFMVGRTMSTMLDGIAKHEGYARFATLRGAVGAALLPTLAAELSVLMMGVFLMSMASRELTAPEWDLEWLVTLPIPQSTLLALRVLERTLVNPAGLVILWPFATVVAWSSGFRLGAPVLAAACAVPLLALVAAAWAATEAGLRMRLAAPRLRNAQALITVLTFAAYFVGYSPLTGTVDVVYWMATTLGQFWRWSPPGLAIGVLTAETPGTAARDFGSLVAEAALGAGISLAIMRQLLRSGVVTGGGRESGRRGAGVAVRAREGRAPWRPSWLSVVQRREIRLLLRDRNFMVQTLLMPLLIVGLQSLFGMRKLHLAGVDPTNLMAAAFGVAAYALMFSAFQVLNSEGQALWLLFTLPRRLDKVLREKAMLWAGLAAIYPIALAAFAMSIRGPSPKLVALAVGALAGVPIFATIASAFGVLAWDPGMAVTQHRRLRPAFVYLYMALAGMYTFSLYASGLRERGVLMLLTGFVAITLWQKARDHLPYLLDPTAAPPTTVSVADGLIAALFFFVAQAVVAMLSAGQSSALTLIYKSFVWGGAITFATVRFVHWRTRAKGVPRYFGRRWVRSIALGAGGAVVAASAGVVYLVLVRRFGLVPPAPAERAGASAVALLPLVVVAAPVFEEYIFRGLLFGGLARSLSPLLAAVASSAIFAVIHPPASFIPVFVMALVASATYARAGLLLAPALVHAGYNAAVVIAQSAFGM